MEMFEDHGVGLKHASQLDDDRKIGHIACCLVFRKEAGCGPGLFDSPMEINRAYEWAICNAAARFGPRNHWSSMSNILSCVKKLKGMVHFYSSQSNIREQTSNYDILGTDDSHFEDEVVLHSNAEGLSLTTVPHPATVKEEEMFWMSRQLTMCKARMMEAVNLGDDGLNEVGMLLLLHDDAPLSDKFFTAALNVCFRRAHLLLQVHHEFSDVIGSSDEHIVAVYRQLLESNITTAASFAFAVAFDEMTRSRVYPGLERLMGDADQKSWNDQFAIITPNEEVSVSLSSNTDQLCYDLFSLFSNKFAVKTTTMEISMIPTRIVLVIADHTHGLLF